MKKRCILAGLLAFTMIMSGCGSSSTSDESKAAEPNEAASVEENTSSEAASSEEAASVEASSEEVTSSEEAASETASSEETSSAENTITKIGDSASSEPEIEKEPEITFETVNAGDTITTDDVEMTIASAAEGKEIHSGTASGYYESYLNAGDTESFIYFTGTIKNVGTDSISLNNIKASVVVDDKYNYSGYIYACDDDGDIESYQSLKPFQSTTYYITCSIPDELIGTYKTCKFDFGFNKGLSWMSSGKDVKDADYRYTITIAK